MPFAPVIAGRPILLYCFHARIRLSSHRREFAPAVEGPCLDWIVLPAITHMLGIAVVTKGRRIMVVMTVLAFGLPIIVAIGAYLTTRSIVKETEITTKRAAKLRSNLDEIILKLNRGAI